MPRISNALIFTSFLMPVFAFVGTANAETREYNLIINNAKIEINGRSLHGMSINGQIPAPQLEFNEGDDAIINVQNNSDEDTSLHWHGLLLPGEMDGVPGLNGFGGIKPHESFTYKFHIRQAGTYWYHSHSGGQEARGLYGPLIIYPKNAEKLPQQVILLSDFNAQDATKTINNLKAQSGYYSQSHRTIGDFFADAKKFGAKAATQDRLAWGKMRMDPTDLADVSGYDFLINGKANSEKQSFLTIPNQKMRLRIINGSAMTYFDFRIPDMKMKVIAADGRDIDPVEVDEMRIAVAETYDVEITPDNKAHTIVAESMDRSGQAIAFLTPNIGQYSNIPPMRQRAILTMNDMGMGGMDMSQMDHSKMSPEDMKQMHEGMGHSMGNMKTLGDNGGTDGKGRTYGWGSEFPVDEKVLNYSDLASFKPQADLRDADREIIIRLGGNMERYIWTINGQSGDNIPPINLKYGERVKLIFINDSMMAHPMHLHGNFVQINNGQSMDKMPDKHIVSVPPGQTLSAYLTAEEIGEWSFHCHLLNHMASGMMTKVVVAKYDGSNPPPFTGKGDHAKHGGGGKSSASNHMNHNDGAMLFHRYDLQLSKSANQDLDWETKSWIGGDLNKVYLHGEGHGKNGNLALLYGRKIADFWDFQGGIGNEFGNQTYAQFGFHGLAPYNFETDAHLLLGKNLAAINFESENKFYLSQKIILIPKIAGKINFQENGEFKTGINELEYGISANYKITPNFVPFVEIKNTQNWNLKNAANFNESQTSLGLKIWF